MAGISKIRILILTTHLNIGGITSHLADLVSGLVKRGHQVTVGSSGGELSPQIAEAGAQVLPLGIRTKSELSPRLWKAIPALIRWIRAHEIQVVHAHTRVTQVAAECVFRAADIPNIATCHGLYKRRLGRRLFPCWGVKSIAISDIVRRHLIDDFCVPESRVVLVRNGLNVGRFLKVASPEEKMRIRRSYGLASDSIVFGIVARVAQVKGHEFFLRSLAALKEKYPDRRVQGLIVGDGDYKDRVVRVAHGLGLDRKVCFVPAVRDPTEPLSVIDVFVFPVIWQEGFGLSVLEAMAVGLPVIASRIGAIDTIVEDRISGFLTPVQDVGEISRYMELLSRDRSLARKMGEMGRKIVEEKFSVDHMTDEVEEVYHSVLEGACQKAPA
ncbi:MAG: glycosyltransferase family 4 protein [Candidatus Omnitrophica bacterium]|nr:glycosyltransferase family 4 protein [Candidatus Omnitrophota bacterium]